MNVVNDTNRHPLNIAIIGPSRFGIGEPYAGGLEAHTAGLVRLLHGRGHRLSVFAGPDGEQQHLPISVQPVVGRHFDSEFEGRRDTTHPIAFCRHESEAYRQIAERVAHQGDVDVVHNNSLHPATVDADPGDGSFVHVLHCPPFPQLEAAHRRLSARSDRRQVIAVSHALAALWGNVATSVVHNGVDDDVWCPHPAVQRQGAVWAGRLVEEKAPHLAVRAAKLAGIPMTLAGPVGDERYFDRYVRNELGSDVQWVGPLKSTDLASLYRSARVGVVSPTWDEPFCLVAAEMLSCGTPVAAFDRGGLREFVTSRVGALATPGDAVSLAAAIKRSLRISADTCTANASVRLSSQTMVEQYEAAYARASHVHRCSSQLETHAVA